MHLEIIDPDLIMQAVLETISSMPERKIKRVMLIPGFGNHSSSKWAGRQSCLVACLLSIANIHIERLEGTGEKVNDLKNNKAKVLLKIMFLSNEKATSW